MNISVIMRINLFIHFGFILATYIGLLLFIYISQNTIFRDIYVSVANTFFIASLFILLLTKFKGHTNLISEIGFVYIGFIILYILFPAIVIVFLNVLDAGILSNFLPTITETASHINVMNLFLFSFCLGYLLLRNKKEIPKNIKLKKITKDYYLLLILVAMIILSYLILAFLSAPVETYYDNYTRYDHLPGYLRAIASILVRLNWGLYVFIFLFLFILFPKRKLLLFTFLIFLSIVEFTFTSGARINILIYLILFIVLWNLFVRQVSVKSLIVPAIIVSSIFSILEIVRLDDSSNIQTFLEAGLPIAREFGSVFLTSFHLYYERETEMLATIPSPVFWWDFISLIPFLDFSQYNPMVWYWKTYYPTSQVAPFTLGPIANSAMWGGLPDLFLRGLINGLFFAFLVNLFTKYSSKWWMIAIYVYCIATTVLVIKYSIFFHVNLVFKNILPLIIILYVFRRVNFLK